MSISIFFQNFTQVLAEYAILNVVKYSGFLVQFQNLFGGSSTPTINYWIQAECLRIQLSSDAIYQEKEIDSTVSVSQGHHLFKTPLENPDCYLYL